MAAENSSSTSILLRLVAAFVLVFATWNAEGWSYYQWAIEPLLHGARTFSPLKFLAGTVLLAGWVVFLQATRRSIGLLGTALVAAIAGGVIWLLISSGLVTANSGRGMARVILIAISIILAVGMSWSHVSRRMSGQADIDVVD
ncbi:hypothetical protein GPROT1_03318 [Gammaproteobacteria bacterium]|nr:hypothetical protein GPROT1_03318 [Gammaproteobacteria bacterium]